MANFQPDALIEYDGRLLNGTDLLYDTTQGVRIWGNSTQDNYSIGDTTTGGVDVTYGLSNTAIGASTLSHIADNITLSGVSISTAGSLTCTSSSWVKVGYVVEISGNLGTGTISGYNPLISNYYYIITPITTGIQFTLSSTYGDPDGDIAITTTAGTIGTAVVKIYVNKTYNVGIGSGVLQSIGQTYTPSSYYGVGATGNIAIGKNSLQNVGAWNPSNPSGAASNNISLGYNNGRNLYTASKNIFIGKNIFSSNTLLSASNVIAIGSEIQGNYTDSNAVIITNQPIYTDAIYGALYTSVIIGGSKGSTTQGNTIIGYGSQVNNGITSTTLVGGNTVLGMLSSVGTGGTGTTTNNIVIGNSCSIGGFGTVSQNIVIGYNLTGLGGGSNNIVIGGSVAGLTGSNNINILTTTGTSGFQYTSSSDRITLTASTHNILGNVKVSSVAGTPVYGIENELDISSTTANGFGYYGSGIVQASTTSSAIGLYQINNLLSSHPGLANFDSFRAAQGTFSTTTPPDVQSGFRAMQSLISAKLNYGFLGTLPLQSSRTVAAASGLVRDVTGTSVTCTTTVAHGYIAGNLIAIYNTDDPLFEVKSVAIATVPTTTTFTYAQVGTASATTNNGTVYSLSNLNLNMNGAAANSFAGRLLVGRSVPAIETMQVVQAPGTTVLQPDNQFLDGIMAIKNSTTVTYGADISLLRSANATYTDMTALPTGYNIGHIWWGVPDGRKYVAAGSIHMRTTATTTAMTSGGGGATTDLIIKVATAAEPAEIARFTGLTGQLQMAAGKSITIEGVQLNTSTKANTAWLASGTANGTTFLRGDGTWATATGTVTTTSIARTFALMGA